MGKDGDRSLALPSRSTSPRHRVEDSSQVAEDSASLVKQIVGWVLRFQVGLVQLLDGAQVLACLPELRPGSAAHF